MKKLSLLLFTLFCTVMFLAPNEKASALTSTSSAQQIELNQHYEGVIPNVSTKHYYRITLPKDGQIKLSIKNVRGITWKGQLFDLQGKELDFFSTNPNDFAQPYEYVQTGLAAGSYYVVIDEQISAVGKTYSFSVDFTEGQYFEKEYNDSNAVATEIQFDKAYKANIHTRDDLDYYKIQLNKNGNVTLKIPNVAGAVWRADVYDSEGKIHISHYTNSSSSVSGDSKNQIGLPKGTYYVKVTAYNIDARELPYKLTVSFTASEQYEKEHNDSVAIATSLKLNTLMKGQLNYKNTQDKDYYKFVLPSNGNVQVVMSQKTGAKWVNAIYDSNGNQVYYGHTDNSSTAKSNLTKTFNLKKGTYYFLVSDYTSADNIPYQFKITQVTPTPVKKNVVIKNNKGKKDTITVKGVTKGATIKVYNASSKQIATVKATNTTATLSVSQLGKKAGKVYVTIQDPNKIVSARLTVNFSVEK